MWKMHLSDLWNRNGMDDLNVAAMEPTSWKVEAIRPEKLAIEKAAGYTRKPGASLIAAKVATVEIVTRDSRC